MALSKYLKTRLEQINLILHQPCFLNKPKGNLILKEKLIEVILRDRGEI